MSIAEEYLDLFDVVAASIDISQVSHIYLPQRVEDVGKRDEFGFVFLQDGSVGPFYTGLEGVLPELWQHYPDGRKCSPDTLALIQYFASQSLALRSIALGAINAVSHHVMRLAGYSPVDAGTVSSVGLGKPVAGETVCMVGCFEPLIEKFQEQDIEVLVLEKNPDRVNVRDGVRLGSSPAELSACEHILCTASTLINGSLETILEARNQSSIFSLIGPSGSILPDILFSRGVGSVGGICFSDAAVLQAALDAKDSWGQTGSKYQLLPDSYPGIHELLDRCVKASNSSDA